MGSLRDEHTARSTYIRILLLLGIALLVPMLGHGSTAEAKGPVWFTFCGENSCVRKSAPRFTAAMLYGGRTHAAPSCATRVHAVTAVFVPSSDKRRYLVVASRGLIGEQGRRGRVWWRQVRGNRKQDLIRAVRGTGPGHKANLDLGIDLFRRDEGPVRKWHLDDDGHWSVEITCDL